MENKCCMQCGSPIKGRRDKKFCDDHCRNNYYNSLHMNRTNMMRQVHQVLRKNRRILENALGTYATSERIPLGSLLEEGFLPGYHTKFQTDAEGKTLFYCYEYGFQLIDDHIRIFVVPFSKAA